MGRKGIEWGPGDVERMARWLNETQASLRRPRRILALSTGLLVLSVLASEYVEHSMPRSRWGLIPVVAVWASGTVAAVTAVVVVMGWRILRIIRQGLAEAQRSQGSGSVSGTHEGQ